MHPIGSQNLSPCPLDKMSINVFCFQCWSIMKYPIFPCLHLNDPMPSWDGSVSQGNSITSLVARRLEAGISGPGRTLPTLGWVLWSWRTVGTLGELWDELSPVTKLVVFFVASCGKKFQLKTVQVCRPWCRELKLGLHQMVSHRMFIVGIVTPRVIDLGNLGVAVVAVGQKSKRHVTYAWNISTFSPPGTWETWRLGTSLRVWIFAPGCQHWHCFVDHVSCPEECDFAHIHDEHVANIIEDHTANLSNFQWFSRDFLDSVWCGHWQFSCWSLLVWSLITPTGSLRSQERDSSLDNGMAPTGGKIQWLVSNILENLRFYHTLGWLVQLGCSPQHVTTCFRQTTRCRGFDLECWNTLKHVETQERNQAQWRRGSLQLELGHDMIRCPGWLPTGPADATLQPPTRVAKPTKPHDAGKPSWWHCHFSWCKNVQNWSCDGAKWWSPSGPSPNFRATKLSHCFPRMPPGATRPQQSDGLVRCSTSSTRRRHWIWENPHVDDFPRKLHLVPRFPSHVWFPKGIWIYKVPAYNGTSYLFSMISKWRAWKEFPFWGAAWLWGIWWRFLRWSKDTGRVQERGNSAGFRQKQHETARFGTFLSREFWRQVWLWMLIHRSGIPIGDGSWWLHIPNLYLCIHKTLAESGITPKLSRFLGCDNLTLMDCKVEKLDFFAENSNKMQLDLTPNISFPWKYI